MHTDGSLIIRILQVYYFCSYYPLGIPLEEKKEEEENVSWAGKLCSLIYKIKGIEKTEKREATEEEEKYPSKNLNS